MALDYYRDRSDLIITQGDGALITISYTAAPLEQEAIRAARKAASTSFAVFCATIIALLAGVDMVIAHHAGLGLVLIGLWSGAVAFLFSWQP